MAHVWPHRRRGSDLPPGQRVVRAMPRFGVNPGNPRRCPNRHMAGRCRARHRRHVGALHQSTASISRPTSIALERGSPLERLAAARRLGASHRAPRTAFWLGKVSPSLGLTDTTRRSLRWLPPLTTGVKNRPCETSGGSIQHPRARVGFEERHATISGIANPHGPGRCRARHRRHDSEARVGCNRRSGLGRAARPRLRFGEARPSIRSI